MLTDFNILHLIGLFLALFLIVKIVGTILFWLLSFILGNKLAALLQNTGPASAAERSSGTHED